MADKGISPQTALRLGYGLVPIVAGADKFTNLLVDWDKYLSPSLERALPISGRTFMKLVGLVEIGAGLAVLSPWTKLGAYAVAGWLCGITLNLLMPPGFYDVALRDFGLALGAFALGLLALEYDRPEGKVPANVP